MNLETEDKFKDIYSGKKNIAEVEAKTVFCKLEGYHTLRKALEHIDKNYIKQVEPYILDEIAYALTLYKTDSRIKSHLKDKGIADDIIEQVSNISFSQYGHLSIKALRKIIPYLEQGMTYDKACEACGYNFNQIKLPDTTKEFIDQITNPVVRRGVAQTLKVVDAIIRCYGAPAKIHIELARDMSRNFTERKK